MLIHQLRRLATVPEVAAGMAPEGYELRRVRHVIDLAGDGRPLGVTDLAQDGPGGARGALRQVPAVMRTSDVAPTLLADGPDYLFGLPPGGDRPARDGRARRCRDAFLGLVADCALATGSPEVAAVERFLRSGRVPPGIDPAADVITFTVDGTAVTDLPEVRGFWRDVRRESAAEPMECLVCGRRAPVAASWPVPVKGIPHGQSAGTQLVSASRRAFQSYGLESSRTSPTCVECAASAARALNWLLERPARCLRLAHGVLVQWTIGPGRLDVLPLLAEPRPAAVAALERATVGPAEFFAAELAASGSRVAVRTWIEDTAPAVRDHLVRYFRRLAVVRPDGSQPRPAGLRELLRGAAQDGDEGTEQLAHDLVDVALTGRRVPARLLAAVVRRSRNERRVTPARAALTRMALLDGAPGTHEEVAMIQLDPEEGDPAYLCGRLLAALEAAERAARGRLQQSLTDRSYRAVSCSPATALPALLGSARSHLTALRRSRWPAYDAIESRIVDIAGRLPSRLPARLALEEQARFGLGYYHQRAADRAAARPPGSTPAAEEEEP
ncbi:MAG: hypothetical protein E6J41_25715 [Chloroflexi bacterium]|nr:MAG: hypothetical protein E6J41_25715 [Chloroflexota bacterium]